MPLFLPILFLENLILNDWFLTKTHQLQRQINATFGARLSIDFKFKMNLFERIHLF
jgi:hypothetical protein